MKLQVFLALSALGLVSAQEVFLPQDSSDEIIVTADFPEFQPKTLSTPSFGVNCNFFSDWAYFSFKDVAQPVTYGPYHFSFCDPISTTVSGCDENTLAYEDGC